MSKTRIELATEKFKEQWHLLDGLGLTGYRVVGSLLAVEPTLRSVTPDEVRHAGAIALQAYDDIPYSNTLTNDQMLDFVGTAVVEALGLTVVDDV